MSTVACNSVEKYNCQNNKSFFAVFPPQVFDRSQYVNMEREGLGDLVMCNDIRQTDGRHTGEMPNHNNSLFVLTSHLVLWPNLPHHIRIPLSDQILEVGTAWEQGYRTMRTCMQMNKHPLFWRYIYLHLYASPQKWIILTAGCYFSSKYGTITDSKELGWQILLFYLQNTVPTPRPCARLHCKRQKFFLINYLVTTSS